MDQPGGSVHAEVSEQALAVNSSARVSANEKVKVVIIYSVLGLGTVLAFTASVIVGRVTVLLAGLGIVAYVLGLRHGMDADHIAAIDNTTRKLMQEKNQHPFTVGMWFSLGHSVIVGVLVVALIFATRSVLAHLPALESSGPVIATSVSGLFLLLIGTVNMVIVLNIYGTFKELRHGKLNGTELESQLDNGGFNRYFKALFKIVKSPWQIFPIGVLFGLGFDTASQVALLGISIGLGVSASVPIWMILVLPLMFTCGMVLTDTTDGVTMRMAYGWAFQNPIRKIYYNLSITVISVLVAYVIGAIELLQVIATESNLTGAFWVWLCGLDFETLGFGIIVMFLASWLVSVAVWKYRRFDEIYKSNFSSTN
jgi:high-affinity nickel-transport protein